MQRKFNLPKLNISSKANVDPDIIENNKSIINKLDIKKLRNNKFKK